MSCPFLFSFIILLILENRWYLVLNFLPFVEINNWLKEKVLGAEYIIQMVQGKSYYTVNVEFGPIICTALVLVSIVKKRSF